MSADVVSPRGTGKKFLMAILFSLPDYPKGNPDKYQKSLLVRVYTRYTHRQCIVLRKWSLTYQTAIQYMGRKGIRTCKDKKHKMNNFIQDVPNDVK